MKLPHAGVIKDSLESWRIGRITLDTVIWKSSSEFWICLQVNIPWRKALCAHWSHLPESSSPSSWLSSQGTDPSAAIPFPSWQHFYFSGQPLETWASLYLSPPIILPESGPGVSTQDDGTSALKFSLTHKGKDPPHVGPGLLQKAGICFVLSPLSRSFKRLHLFWGHTVTEWASLEGTTVDHLVPPPCSSRVIPEDMAQAFNRTLLRYLHEGHSTPSLGSVFHCVVACAVKIFLL